MGTSRPHAVIAAFLLVASTLIAAEASATTTIALDLGELSVAADEVVVARVITSTPEPAQGMIVTRHVVEVESSIAGVAGPWDDLEVITAGGELDGLGVLVHGAPRLRTGQRYLLFLRHTGNAFVVVGQAQGALRVHEDAGTGDTVVEPAEALPSLVRMERGRLVSAIAAVVAPTPLDTVIAAVREARHGR